MASVVLTPDAPLYPAGVRAALGDEAPAALAAIGDAALLGRRPRECCTSGDMVE